MRTRFWKTQAKVAEGAVIPDASPNKALECQPPFTGNTENKGLSGALSNGPEAELASEAGRVLLDRVNACSTSDDLDQAYKQIAIMNGGGVLPDAEAQVLYELVQARRGARRAGARASVGRALLRSISRFVSRQVPRSADRQASRERRRMLGGSSSMPEDMRKSYTEGLRAVLCVIAAVCKRQGVCDLPIDKIAALAGVCRTTVQTALHEARRLGHIAVKERPQRGRKSLTNVIMIASRQWLAWIKKGVNAASQIIGSKTLTQSKVLSPTKIKEERKEEKKEASDGGGGRGLPPVPRPQTMAMRA